MAVWLPSPRRRSFATCLHGRLICQGRSFPVTVTGLSDAGLTAEGPDLSSVDGPFAVEIAFETAGDSAWNPKASGPQFLHFFTAEAIRSEESSGALLSGLFTSMGEPAHRLLEDFLAQLGRAREARSRGGALPRLPMPHASINESA